MSDDPNMPDEWAPGQPAPWLDQFGPQPIDPSLAGSASSPSSPPGYADVAVGAPPPAPPPQPMPSADLSQALGAPAPAAALPAIAPDGQPAAPSGPQTFTPPWLAPPAATPTPDAVSGAADVKTASGFAPIVADHANIAMDPNAPIGMRQQAWQALSPQQRTDLVNNTDPSKLATVATAAMSPEDLATINIRHQQAQIHAQSAAQLTLMQKADEDARTNFQTYQQATQKANADTAALATEAAAIANTKVDPEEHGVGHFIASVVTGTLGGIGATYNGGRNLALEELDKKSEQRIQAQKDNIANRWKGVELKKNFIAESVQRSGDMYRAQEAYRISSYDRAVSELQTKAQDYDPQGTTALRIAGTVQQIGAQKQAALMAFNQQQLTNHLAVAKETREQQLADSTTWKNKQDVSLAWAKEHREGAAAKAAETPMPVAMLAQRYPGMPMPDPNAYPKGITNKEYDQWLDTNTKGKSNKAADLSAEEKGNATIIRNSVTGKPLTYPDDPNKPVRAATPELAEKTNTMVSFAQTALDQLSTIRRTIESDPSMTDRKAFAALETNYEMAKTAYIKSLGANPSQREMDAMTDTFGANFSSFTDRLIGEGKAEARIDEVIKGIKLSAANNIRSTTGADVRGLLLDTSQPPTAAETEVNKETKALEFKPTGKNIDSVDDRDKQFYGPGFAGPATGSYAAALGQKNADPALQRAYELGIAPSKLDLLDKLQADALGDDMKARTDALEILAKTAKSNENGAIREYAKDLIKKSAQNAGESFASPDLPPLEPATAHVEAPPPAPAKGTR